MSKFKIYRSDYSDARRAGKRNDILKIELENYFKNLSFAKPGSYTRSLKITKTDSTEEVLIISNKSIDYKQKITIEDSLKTLKKLTNIEIQINNN